MHSKDYDIDCAYTLNGSWFFYLGLRLDLEQQKHLMVNVHVSVKISQISVQELISVYLLLAIASIYRHIKPLNCVIVGILSKCKSMTTFIFKIMFI